MAGWPESRACLSAGWARHRAHCRTYKRTQVVRAVNGPAAYERRARCAPPGESGQPSAYDLRKFGPAEHHAYHSMVLVECAIVTNRVPVLAGHAWPNLKGHINRIHQPATVGRRVLRWPSGTTTAGAGNVDQLSSEALQYPHMVWCEGRTRGARPRAAWRPPQHRSLTRRY